MQGGRSISQPPRYNPVSQVNTESHGGGSGSSERTVRLDSLSLPAIREQPLAQSSGFGSPLPFLKMLKPPEAQRPPQGHQSGLGSGAQIGAMSRSMGQGHLPGRPPTAQLTIFYSGMVNVYDDVPADKAQAIMLLAGSGSSWSSSSLKPPTSVSGRPPSAERLPVSSSYSQLPNPVPASVSVAASAPPTAVAVVVPQSLPATTPVVPAIPLPAGHKPGPGRPHAELPQARKASLFRFLEKRKDRVRGKAPYVTPTFVKKDAGSSTPPREKSPSPSNSMIRTRSPSPANSVPNMNIISRKRSASPAQRPGLSQPSGSETSSPSRRPGTPQQAPRPSSSEEQASSGLQRQSKEDRTDWRNQQHLHPASQEERHEPMEVGSASPSQRH